MTWAPIRLKHAATVRFGFPFDARRFTESGGVPVVRIRDLESQSPSTLTDETGPDWARVDDGDVLVGMDGEFRATVWRGQPSWLNQRVCAIDPRPGFDARYLAYAVQPPLDAVQAVKFSTTVKHLSADDVLNLPIAASSEADQRSIADFLDVETARIDAMIRARSRQVSLFAERAATVRDTACSSIVPRERLGYGLLAIEQGWSPACETRLPEPHEWGVLKAGATNYGAFHESESKALPADLRPRMQLEVRVGDVLMSRANTRELAGSAAYVEECRPRLMISDKLYRVVPNRAKLEPRYLALVLQSAAAREQIQSEAVGSSGSMQNISQQVVRDLRLPIPPLEQQARIVAQCERVTTHARQAVATIRRQVGLLHERRQALITAAVTGQFQVPSAGVASKAA